MATDAARWALEAAKRQIKHTNGDELYLNIEDCRALERVPVEIADLKHLRVVNLNDTAVADLSALAGLSKLEKLRLNQTSVSDLTPLAGLTRLVWLDLNQTKVSNLTPLSGLKALQQLRLSQNAVSDLSPIAELTMLLRLSLDQTIVSDLSPLARLRLLEDLTLGSTQVADLRPIRDLSRLGTSKPTVFGLGFEDTPAIVEDAELARLNTIRDVAKRARETLAYLQSLPPWPEPYTPRARPDGRPPKPILSLPAPPKQDPALRLVWGERGFAFLAAQIDADPVTEAALADLRALLDDLRRKGNRHDDLYWLAGEMQERAAGQIADLNMVRLHLSYQKLRRVYQGRSGRNDHFDDETVSVIASVLEILPGVTLADPCVKVLIDRQDAERSAEVTVGKAAAELAFLKAIRSKDSPFAPEVKDAAQVIALPGMDDRLSASRGILSRNGLISVMQGVVGGVIAAPITGPVGNFVYEYSTEILSLARTMGDDVWFWVQMLFSSFKAEYEVAVGISREALGSGLLGQKRREEKS